MSKIFRICNSVLKLLPYGFMNGVKRSICLVMYNLSKGEKRQLWFMRMEKFAFRSGKNLKQLNRNIDNVIADVRKRVAKKHKATVYFICHEVAQWTFQSIYDAMAEDPRFDPYVFCSNQWIQAEVGSESVRDYCNRKGMNAVDVVDFANPPDVVFFSMLDKGSVSMPEMAECAVLCYIPYSWMLSVASDDYFWRDDKLAYFSRVYTPTVRESKIALTGRCINPPSVVCSGNPKMDEQAKAVCTKTCSVWKTTDAKRIIWAPHWSIGCASDLGTFDLYCRKMLDFVKKHKEIEVCLKPHPMLRSRIASEEIIDDLKRKGWYWRDAGITGNEYDGFLKEWDLLQNASIMDSGGYEELFATSDAMVLDSISFIAEYMAHNKPMCFISRDSSSEKLKSRFNDIGWDLLSSNRVAFSWDDIEKFIEGVARGADDDCATREDAIARHLIMNYGHVGEFIKDDLSNLLFGQITEKKEGTQA